MRRYGVILPYFVLVALSVSSSLFSASFESQRENLVKELRSQGITDEKVLGAIGKVPRERFVEKAYLNYAYVNHALPITEGQTISQPLIVALMTQALQLKGKEKVLEIGTGSGYQAAILAEVVKSVYTIEIKKSLAEKAQERLRELGYTNVQVKAGDGFKGWQEQGPFDAIIITAASGKIPPPLLDQLAEGGRLIIPLGASRHHQELTLVIKKGDKLERKILTDVVFVRMTGEAEAGGGP